MKENSMPEQSEVSNELDTKIEDNTELFESFDSYGDETYMLDSSLDKGKRLLNQLTFS